MNRYQLAVVLAVLSIAVPGKADVLPRGLTECQGKTERARCPGGACVASRCSSRDWSHWDASSEGGPPFIDYDCLLCVQGADAGPDSGPPNKDGGNDAGHPAKHDGGPDAGHPAKHDGGHDAGHPARKHDGGRDAGHGAKKDASSAAEGGLPTGTGAGSGCDCRLDPSHPMKTHGAAMLLAALVPLLLRRRRSP